MALFNKKSVLNRPRFSFRVYSAAVCLALALLGSLFAVHTATARASYGVKSSDPEGWCDSTVWINKGLNNRRVRLVSCTQTPADTVKLRHTFKSVTHALVLYGELTGVPYPWPRYELNVIPQMGTVFNGGMSAEDGATLFAGALPDIRADHDESDVSRKIFVHELAHQWFPRYVMSKGRSEKLSQWLAEGFSDFMTAQEWGKTGGPQREEEFLFFYNTQWSSWYEKSPDFSQNWDVGYLPYDWYSIPWQGASIWQNPLDGEVPTDDSTNKWHGDDPYYRGALTLWMLKRQLGDTHFWAAVRTYLTSTDSTADAHSLQRAIYKVTGDSLDWFFKEWVYGRSYPRFTVTSEYDSTSRSLRLNVKQELPVFRMPVTIRVGTAAGDVLAHATVDSASQTIVVDKVSGPPKFVVFDDEDAIVKTMQFEQPTAWLAAQLMREAHSWQTWWAIMQLRERATRDPAAASAIIAAALHGQYALTRAQAMVALSHVKTDEALAALTAGTHDKAVNVRRGAARALDGIGTRAAWEVERTTFERDSSPIVQAEAIQSLLSSPLASSAERVDLLAKALSRRSYRRAIQYAAVRSATETHCDSAVLATLRAGFATPGVETSIYNAEYPLASRNSACAAKLKEMFPN